MMRTITLTVVREEDSESPTGAVREFDRRVIPLLTEVRDKFSGKWVVAHMEVMDVSLEDVSE